MKSLLGWIATGILCSQLAAGQTARPDPAGIAVIERANASLSPAKAFENLEIKAGKWQVNSGAIVQGDRAAPFARAFIKGPSLGGLRHQGETASGRRRRPRGVARGPADRPRQ